MNQVRDLCGLAAVVLAAVASSAGVAGCGSKDCDPGFHRRGSCPSGNYVSSGACDLANGIQLNESRPFGSTNNQPQGLGPFTATLFDSRACKPATNKASDVNSAYALCCPR